jgi:hypothetical protein
MTDPYLISTGAQLAYLAAQVNGGIDYYGQYFKLTADLDLNGDNHEWTAIGTYVKPFKGSFDGADHVIYRLTIDDDTADYQGLFGCLDGAQVKHLGLVDLDIKGGNHVGGVAGYVYNSSIENSYSTGDVSGNGAVGGVAGLVGIDSIVENSYSSGDISGTNWVGGVAGSLVADSIIENSYSTGAVSGTEMVGGVAGLVHSSSIENSYSTGAVTGDGCVGGVAGRVDSSGAIQHCAALNPSVRASSAAGRVVGYIYGANTVDNNVAWDGMSDGGGVDFNTSSGNAGTSKTAEELSTQSTYTGLGWDFTLIWKMGPGNETYTALPILKWQ